MMSRVCPARTARLHLEELEPRQLLSGAAPTAVEQLFLEQLNDARANPAAYGASIGIDLSGVAPSQPLAFDPALIAASRGHSQDMSARNYFAHNTPEGIDPGQRMTAAGFPWNSWGESIAAGSVYAMPADTLKALIIDSGVPDLGHRRHLLAIDALFKGQDQVGIGVVQNGTGAYTNYYTVDSASTFDSRPFITGVVFNDLNNNGKYDVGESLGGVTVTIPGVGTTTSFDSGGYSLHVSPGTYTVTASGGNLVTPVTQTITIGTSNYRLNFTPNYDGLVQKLYQTDLGRAATPGDVSYWSQMARSYGPAAVTVAVGHSTEAESRLVNSWYQAYLGRSAYDGQGRFGGQYWVNLLQQGRSEEQVLSMILGSPEYFNHSAQVAGLPPGVAGSVRTYIQALYSQLFTNHFPSESEISFWTSQLSRLGTSGLAYALLMSGEHRGTDVQTYYASLLGRKASPAAAEVNFWVNSGWDIATIRMYFETTPEFATGQ